MKFFLMVLMGFIFVIGCKNIDDSNSDNISENAQQVGDVMASIDEAGGSSGSIAGLSADSVEKTFARLAPEDKLNESVLAKILLPNAEAVACYGFGFGSCTASGTLTRSYNNCTIGSATLSGDVTLAWSNGSTCSLGSTTQHITRVPNFTVTGLRGATLRVTKTGSIGQRITWVSGAGASKVFSFSNDGINRTFTGPTSNVLFNQTTATSGTLTITGTDRTSRVMTSAGGAALVVTNNLSSVVCTYTPNNVTWSSSTCNCPVAGSWAGTCTNGKSVTIDINGCGTANYTEGDETQAVTFDRCSNN